MNLRQLVGQIETIGSQYPIIVTNNNMKYHNGSLTALAIQDSYYSISRIAVADYRTTLENFFTNKSPKILKDWNGNMWLIMFVDNVNLEFTNDWGMGLASVSCTWAEIGNAESQEDLQDCGLIDLGGV